MEFINLLYLENQRSMRQTSDTWMLHVIFCTCDYMSAKYLFYRLILPIRELTIYNQLNCKVWTMIFCILSTCTVFRVIMLVTKCMELLECLGVDYDSIFLVEKLWLCYESIWYVVCLISNDYIRVFLMVSVLFFCCFPL